MSDDLAYLYIAISAASLFLVGLILTVLLFKAIRLLTRSNYVFGLTPRIRLISLGLAALVSPSTIPIVLGALAIFVLTLFTEASGALYENWKHLEEGCRQAQASCTKAFPFYFLNAWTTAFNKAYSEMPQLPIARFIIVLMLWAIFSHVLTNARLPEQDGTSTGRSKGTVWSEKLRQQLSSVTGYNLAFFLLLAIGGYLSIAAIAAIPGLQEKAPASAEMSPDKLKQQLEGSLTQLNAFPETLPITNPFERLEKYLKERERNSIQGSAEGLDSSKNTSAVNKNGTDTKNQSENAGTNQSVAAALKNASPSPSSESPSPGATAVKEVDDRLVTQQSLRQQLLTEWKGFLDSTKSQLQSKKDQAVSIYANENSDGRGSKERNAHFIAIDDWFRYWTTEANTRLGSCSRQINQINQMWAIWADNAYNALASGQQAEPVFFSRAMTELYPTVQATCRSIQIDERAPDRTKMGSDLGPFTFVAKWLLQTESLPLALITGLLGFGLLGSACSTFIREHPVRQSGEPIVKDLQGVVIRGLSAAIVIFLAVEGGLAIFSGNSAEPNPYVLLFTCLVAAVFSEDVWNWAHKKLLDGFGDKGAKNSPSAPSDGKDNGRTKEKLPAAEPADIGPTKEEQR